MKIRTLLLLAAIMVIVNTSIAQDTFSIVAIDTITGEVGSAGASCVDMSNFPGYTDDFLGELFPGLGAINTQAYYHPTNQSNARDRMNLGDTPSQIIDWLVENDVSGQPQLRQYGIVAVVDESPQSAAHTGIATDDYKNHVLGPNYSIQGNILLGQEILDSMEYRFLTAEGDLACKLMAAMQGANVIGADTRCSSNGTSSLFAFIKVAQPDDIFGEPSFLLSLRTSSGDNIEPIDSLQTMFDEVHDCYYVGIFDHEEFRNSINIFPNPTSDLIVIESSLGKPCSIEVYDIYGKSISTSQLVNETTIDISVLSNGIYILEVSDGNYSYTERIIKR